MTARGMGKGLTSYGDAEFSLSFQAEGRSSIGVASRFAVHVGRHALDGFTPEQRTFLAWGQVWCENRRPEALRMMAQTNPHSPGRYRVNGVVSNMPEFQKAFSCKADAPMVRQNPVASGSDRGGHDGHDRRDRQNRRQAGARSLRDHFLRAVSAPA